MNEIRITSSQKYLWWLSAFLTLLGASMMGGLAYQFSSDASSINHWYIEIFFGFCVIYFGMSNLLKIDSSGVDEIVINNEEIRSNQSSKDGNSLRWETLKQVKLYNEKIEGASADSGVRKRLKIPFGMRFSSDKMQRLKQSVSDQCVRHGVLFEAKF
jgi:hypothetical protein